MESAMERPSMPTTLTALASAALIDLDLPAQLLSALDFIPTIAELRGTGGMCLLHKAAAAKGMSEHGRVLKAVYDANSDAVSVRDDAGMMPIHHATKVGSTAATALLLAMTQSARAGRKAIVCACPSCSPAVVDSRHSRQSHRQYSGPEPRPVCASWAPESARDYAGMLPLHLALENQVDAELVHMLIDAGAYTDEHGEDKDGHGWEPIHLACAFRARSSVIERLLVDDWEAALVPLAPVPCGRCCRRCTDEERALEVAAVSTTATATSAASPWPPQRFGGCVYSLPIHLAARGGASPDALEALVRSCEHTENCSLMKEGHIIDPYGYTPSDYAIARGAPSDVVERLFGLEASVLPDSPTVGDRGLDRRRRQAYNGREGERRARRRAEPSGLRSSKRPCPPGRRDLHLE